MLRQVLFEILQLAVSIFAIRRGGSPERIVGWLLLAAAIGGLIAGLPTNKYQGIDAPLLALDIVLFASLLLVALRANRFWPYWITALQLIAIGAHGARAIDPTMVPIVYARITGQIAYPMCLVLVIGTYHYLRRSRIEGIPPRPWSPLRW